MPEQSSPSATLSINAPISLGGNVNIDTNGNDGTITGNITGTGSLTKWDTGAATLSGNNTITGSLSVRGGTLNLSGTNSISNGVFMIGGSVGIGSDANLGGTTTPISFKAGCSASTATTLTNIDSHPSTGPPSTADSTSPAPANTFTVNSTISGNGSMTKSGPGVLLLRRSNSLHRRDDPQSRHAGITNDQQYRRRRAALNFQGG